MTAPPCSNCGGPLTLGSIPALVGRYRPDRELQSAPSEEAQLRIVEARWDGGAIPGSEYEFLLDAIHDEAHGTYRRELVVAQLASSEAATTCHALADASSRDADPVWAVQQCIDAAGAPDGAVQLAAIIGLAHLAQRSDALTPAILEALAPAVTDPAAVARLQSVRAYVQRTSRPRPANE